MDGVVNNGATSHWELLRTVDIAAACQDIFSSFIVDCPDISSGWDDFKCLIMLYKFNNNLLVGHNGFYWATVYYYGISWQLRWDYRLYKRYR